MNVNTERAVRSDLAIYSAWCAQRGLDALPASAATVAAFVDDMAGARAPATVRRYVSSIGAAHRSVGHDETTRSEAVKQAMQRMHHRQGGSEPRASGLTRPLVERLLAAPGNRLIDARNRALLAVAYDTLLRRSELVAIQIDDVVEALDGSATVLVRGDEPDANELREVAHLAPDTVALVREWLDHSGVANGRLFRSLRGGIVGPGLHPSQVPRIYKAMARKAGLPPEVADTLSGNSTRVGAMQDMIAAGIGLPSILHAGRWKSTAMVNRYTERLPVRDSTKQLAKPQRRG